MYNIMKRKFIVATALSSLALVGGYLFINQSKNYSPRQESKIEKGIINQQGLDAKSAKGMAQYFGNLRKNIETGELSVFDYNNAIEMSLKNNYKRTVSTIWNERGPDNVGGRTRAFLQDKDTPSLMFVGGVSGGLFRSTTRGLSWRPVNDYQENLNIVSIAQNTDGIICYGTGEGQFTNLDGTQRGTPAFLGFGIFRSTDRGRTFSRVTASANWGNISSMDAETSGGTRIYAGTDNGIKYSDDGLNWVSARSGVCKEIKVASNGHVWAQVGNAILKSTDRGTGWTVSTPTGAVGTRFSIAISPEDPNYVYFMVSSAAGRLDGVYRTTNGGTSWEKIIQQSTIYFDPLISGASSQGNYNNVITVDPKNKNRIIMGGVTLAEWKEGETPKIIASLNDFGGANRQYVHADKHVLEWDTRTNPATLIVGCDGGLFFSSDNLSTFTPKNLGFNATQFYAVAADYEGNVVGGTQDNGTQYINRQGNTPLSAVEIKGGDGFQTDISVKNNSIVFAETYYANVTRSRDFGKSQSCIWDRRIARTFKALSDTAKFCEHSHQSDYAPFNSKFILWEHPNFFNSESRLFLAINGQVWMMLNATDLNKEPEWYMITNTIGSSDVWDIEPTKDGSSVFISNNSSIFRVSGLDTAHYNKWSAPLSIPQGIVTTNLSFTANSGRAITSVNLDPNNENNALITLGNYGGASYVYKGSNMLSTPSYTNITNDLPSMPVYDGLILYSNSSTMFLATDLGVYASDNNGTNWVAQTKPENKFPKVATLALRQYYFPNKNQGAIYAGTHGRGFFECLQYRTSVQKSTAVNNIFNKITAYPNPASEFVNINLQNITGNDITLSVVDVTGKVFTRKIIGNVVTKESNVKLDVSGLQSGNYIVVVTDGKGTKPKGTIKIIVAR